MRTSYAVNCIRNENKLSLNIYCLKNMNVILYHIKQSKMFNKALWYFMIFFKVKPYSLSVKYLLSVETVAIMFCVTSY